MHELSSKVIRPLLSPKKSPVQKKIGPMTVCQAITFLSPTERASRPINLTGKRMVSSPSTLFFCLDSGVGFWVLRKQRAERRRKEEMAMMQRYGRTKSVVKRSKKHLEEALYVRLFKEGGSEVNVRQQLNQFIRSGKRVYKWEVGDTLKKLRSRKLYFPAVKVPFFL